MHRYLHTEEELSLLFLDMERILCAKFLNIIGGTAYSFKD